MKITVGSKSGFCFGVKRAVEGAFNIDEKNTYVFGELVHNSFVNDKLKEKGFIFEDNINNIKDNSNIIIRAHGVSKDIYDKCEIKNLIIHDFTCPNVLKIHNIINEKDSEGYFIILTGDPDHPENIGSLSYAKNITCILDKDSLNDAFTSYENSKCDKLLLISQTTYSVSKFEEIKTIILNKYPDTLVYNTICMATSLRQEEAEKLSKENDAMIIIGGKNSSNTKKLYEVSIKNCKNVYLISDKDELGDIHFDSIGIMAGASTPKEIIDEVVDKIKRG